MYTVVCNGFHTKDYNEVCISDKSLACEYQLCTDVGHTHNI